MTALPTLRTARTRLKVLGPAEWAVVRQYQLANLEHLAQWEPARSSDYFSEAAIMDRLSQSHASSLAGEAMHFAALDLGTGLMVAACSFTNVVRGVFQACHIGYSVAYHHQGCGLMHEVTRAAIAYMFEQQDLHRIMAGHMPSNTRSEKLLRRLGFEREGYARSCLKINGVWEDVVLNSLINPAH